MDDPPAVRVLPPVVTVFCIVCMAQKPHVILDIPGGAHFTCTFCHHPTIMADLPEGSDATEDASGPA